MTSTLATRSADERIDAYDLDGRTPFLGTGAAVRVAAPDHPKAWHARVSYLSGDIFGLRGEPGAEQLFAPRDLVVLRVGRDEHVVECQGRVLATGNRTLRVLGTRGAGATDRRGAPRTTVSAPLTIRAKGTAGPGHAAQLLDLSPAGCALRCRSRLDVGGLVVVSTKTADGVLELSGEVVRAWTTASATWFYAGIRFDHLPLGTREVVHRFAMSSS